MTADQQPRPGAVAESSSPCPKAMRRRARPWLGTLAVIGIAGGFLFGDLTAAQADTPQPNACPNSVGCTPPPPPPPTPITCTITVRTPIAIGPSVQTYGEVECQAPVARIELKVRLTRDGEIMERSEDQIQNSNDLIVGPFLTPCTRGEWQAHGEAWITPNPGYSTAGHIQKSSATLTTPSPTAPGCSVNRLP